MCMWNQLFQNNGGWGRTLINSKKNSIHLAYKERFSQKNHSKLGVYKCKLQ